MDIDIFISHHTNSSLHIVEAIVNKLEAGGVRCWYAPRDTEGAYAGIIAKAISACKVFLLILNKPASESPHVLNELDLVTKRLAKKEDVNIIPFHTADDDITDEAQYYLGRMHWIDALEPPMYQRIDELCSRIFKIFGKDGGNVSFNSPEVKEYKFISKIPEARDVFIGRDELLNEIDSLFDAGNKVLFVQGIGGIGKSELVKQYMLSRRSKYVNMLFVTYSSSLHDLVCNKTQIEISGVEQSLDESDEVFYARKLQILRSIAGEDTLIVVDNYDIDSDPDLDSFTQGDHRIIFTTRNNHSGCKTVFVKPFDDPEKAYDVFLKNFGGEVSAEDKPYIMKLLKKVEYHTYTIELLAKQMNASFLTGKELLEMYESGSMAGCGMEQVEGRKHTDSAFGHILSLFSMSGLTENDKQILRELSLIGIQGIPAQRFKEWAALNNFNDVNKLINQSWIRREKGQLISLHPLVCDVVRYELRPDEDNCGEFLAKMTDYLFYTWNRPVSENIQVKSCAIAVAKYFRPFNSDKIDIWSVIPSFLWQVGEFDLAIELQSEIFNSVVNRFGKNTMAAGFVAKSLGGCYFNAGRLAESIPWYKLGLELMLNSGEPEGEDLAMSYEKVARCCTWDICKDYPRAEEYFQKSLEIRKKLIAAFENGESPRMFEERENYNIGRARERLAECYMEMCRMYQSIGDFEKALEYTKLQRELFEMHKDIGNPSAFAYIDYDEGVSRYNLALRLRADGESENADAELKKAEELLKRSFESNIKMRGDVAIDTIDNQEYLADVYAAQNKPAEASNCYMSVITMLEKLFGPKYERINRVKEKMMFGAKNNL